MPWAMTPGRPASSAASSMVWSGLKSPEAPAYSLSCRRVTGGRILSSSSSPASQAGTTSLIFEGPSQGRGDDRDVLHREAALAGGRLARAFHDNEAEQAAAALLLVVILQLRGAVDLLADAQRSPSVFYAMLAVEHPALRPAHAPDLAVLERTRKRRRRDQSTVPAPLRRRLVGVQRVRVPYGLGELPDGPTLDDVPHPLGAFTDHASPAFDLAHTCSR